MSIEKVRTFFREHNMEHRILEFEASSTTVDLDISLKRFETVFPACGSSNSAIEPTISELEQHSGYLQWVDVCKGWSE